MSNLWFDRTQTGRLLEVSCVSEPNDIPSRFKHRWSIKETDIGMRHRQLCCLTNGIVQSSSKRIRIGVDSAQASSMTSQSWPSSIQSQSWSFLRRAHIIVVAAWKPWLSLCSLMDGDHDVYFTHFSGSTAIHTQTLEDIEVPRRGGK